MYQGPRGSAQNGHGAPGGGTDQGQSRRRAREEPGLHHASEDGNLRTARPRVAPCVCKKAPATHSCMQGSVGEKCTRAQGQMSTPGQSYSLRHPSPSLFSPRMWGDGEVNREGLPGKFLTF